MVKPDANLALALSYICEELTELAGKETAGIRKARECISMWMLRGLADRDFIVDGAERVPDRGSDER